MWSGVFIVCIHMYDILYLLPWANAKNRNDRQVRYNKYKIYLIYIKRYMSSIYTHCTHTQVQICSIYTQYIRNQVIKMFLYLVFCTHLSINVCVFCVCAICELNNSMVWPSKHFRVCDEQNFILNSLRLDLNQNERKKREPKIKKKKNEQNIHSTETRTVF